MTRKIAAGCFAAMFGLAVSAGAQTPSSPQTPPSQPPSTPSQPPTSPYPSGQSSERAGKEVKLTGCIQAGTAANSYELTNIKKGMSSSSSASSETTPPSSTPSASASASASSSDKTVKLVASPSVDLASHVGHTVEVTGKWASGSSSSSAESPSTPPSASASSASGAKEFQVSSVKMISSTCSAGTN